MILRLTGMIIFPDASRPIEEGLIGLICCGAVPFLELFPNGHGGVSGKNMPISNR